MADTLRNDEFIESCLGHDWPKPLYPHGGGREWSTSMRDEWKRDQSVEVVPASRLQEAVEALRRAKRGHYCRPSSRYDGDCPCGATKHNARIDAALDSLGEANMLGQAVKALDIAVEALEKIATMPKATGIVDTEIAMRVIANDAIIAVGSVPRVEASGE